MKVKIEWKNEHYIQHNQQFLWTTTHRRLTDAIDNAGDLAFVEKRQH